MDILRILEESGKELYPIDLEFFETELATGGHYDAAYQSQCRKKIKELRAWMSGETQDAEKDSEQPSKMEKGKEEHIVLGLKNLVPDGAEKVMPELNAEQEIRRKIVEMRVKDTYKAKFREFVQRKPEINSEFIDKNHAFFENWEIDTILTYRELTEEFLEKYFDALDHEKIAKYQKFSESFFMKHFSELDADMVLRQGKNDWRIKENRSKQLDVFLRLKGVKI